MNVNSGGPHILLFERDQQLMTLLSGELVQAGYEVHTARTAVEIFDAIARFPVRLVMVNMAQAQAGRREFWVALDAQRRGRGVQVFTFRCANLGGYGPDDPEEHVETVMTDLEVDGMSGLSKLVDGVRNRVPGSTTTSTPARSAPEPMYEQRAGRPVDVPMASPAQPVASPLSYSQPSQSAARPYPAQEMPPPLPPSRPVEPPPARHSTFTDKIRAVIYPGSRNTAPVPESTWAPRNTASAAQNLNAEPPTQVNVNQRFVDENRATYAHREEMLYQAPANIMAPAPNQPSYPAYNTPSASEYLTNEESGLDQLSRMLRESQPTPNNTIVNGNIQHVAPQPAASSLNIDPQKIQEFRAQIMQAALLDEAYDHSNSNAPQMRQPDTSSLGPQLRASPIQDALFDREVGNRRNPMNNGSLAQPAENIGRPAMTILQPTQAMPPVQGQQYSPTGQASPAQVYQVPTSQQYPPVGQASPAQVYQVPTSQQYPPVGQASPAQAYQARSSQPYPPAQVYQASSNQDQAYAPASSEDSLAQLYQSQSGYASPADERLFQTGSNAHVRSLPPALPETPLATASDSQVRPGPEAPSFSSQRRTSGGLNLDEDGTLADQVQATLQQTLARRPEVRTSDDMLLDIVKSLPPMAPAPQPPQVLSGRATRTLGSVLLEGHLVPQERLQVAQHVQRMLRGVDLNYQLGEILLMFKLLTPDQLLAASLVSYGMISTIQISALGRIRQELHAIGLEYDLESLVVLFRILTPEQLREVRASWSS